MKKIILFSLLLGSVILYSTDKDLALVTRENASVRSENKLSRTQEVEPVTVGKEAVIEEALAEVATTESYEADFDDLTEKEVRSKLASTEKILNQSNLFQLANSEQGMGTSAAKELTELIRIKQALNKILLNRQLEEMHRKYL